MSSRSELRESLCQYITDTLTYIHVVKDFIYKHPEWNKDRERESESIIQTKPLNRIRSESITEASENTLKNTLSPDRAERQERELEANLSDILDITMCGLQQLQMFLDALEKLAVTSVHVFEPNHVLKKADGDNLREIQKIISDSKTICPLLLLFKRDNEAFFSPKQENLEALQHQLDMYIINVHTICSHFTNISHLENPVIDLSEGIPEDHIEKMLSHINKLHQIRMDEAFRMVFLFQGKHFSFMKQYYLHKFQMEEFLCKVEECAIELDKMKTGREISGVVSSSLGVGGGLLSIMALFLTPPTAGMSAALFGAGAGMTALSASTSIATLVTDQAVNNRETEKVNTVFARFKDNTNILQKCLNNIIYNSIIDKGKVNPVVGNAKLTGKTVSVVKCVDTIKDSVTALKGSEMGQTAARCSVSMSGIARVGLIAANILFIGFDVAMIVQNSTDLCKGNESDISKLIRAKAALWSSEIQSWEKMCVSLENGQEHSEKKQELLQTIFYLDHSGSVAALCLAELAQTFSISIQMSNI